jgi:large subunit ribosomal protein L21
MANEKTNTTKDDKFAIIRTGGKQYIVRENETLEVELLPEGTTNFDVLLYADNGKIEVGTPVLDKIKVKATVGEEVKGEKQVVFKYKAKKNYRVKTGHRQHYSQVKIDKIEAK